MPPAAPPFAPVLHLLDPSGPFFSPPALKRVFPHGFPTLDTAFVRALREAQEAWRVVNGEGPRDAAVHWAWIRFVVRDVLGFPDVVVLDGPGLPPSLAAALPQHHETLRPHLAVVNPKDHAEPGRPRLLLVQHPSLTGLERPLPDRPWRASPATRMVELCRGAGVRLGLVTNGEDWLFVNVKAGEPAGFATFRAWSWLEERETLQAFTALLGAPRFFAVAAPDTVEALLDESAKNQQEVTDRLGLQVRHAVEILVQTLDRIDRERGGELLQHLEERVLYDGALTVMMRLVFLLAAEERSLLRLGEEVWDANYSVVTLGGQLREAADKAGEEVLERRTDAWARLLAAFRAVFGGVRHERLSLPAYGGTLFDPDRFPFLEGRAPGTSWRSDPARPLPIDNRTVLHLLESLQVLREPGRRGQSGDARRLSFRALDIEQIGHVYEGLLDHNVRRAEGVVLGLAGAHEPEVPLRTLEALRARGEDPLLDFVAEETGRQKSTVRRALYDPPPADDRRFLSVCDHDAGLYGAVRPYAALLRDDSRGQPMVIRDRAAYVTQASDRRSTGTHYTPRSLTEPIVQHTLDPLVYEGLAEGRPAAAWRLRPARELLDLRVCDPAMGSGAFLVQACRYLSGRLVEAWDAVEAAHPGRVIVTPEGDLSTGDPAERPLPREAEERLALARRVVADRCLFGVDKNPMAVEMAKLSLWLVTLQRDRAFTFLDHALRCGDSLLGVTAPEQLIAFHLGAGPAVSKPPKHSPPGSLGLAGAFTTGEQIPVVGALLAPALRRATALRLELERLEVKDIRDVEAKARLFEESRRLLEDLRLAADLLVGAALSTAAGSARDRDALRNDLAASLPSALDPAAPPAERASLLAELRARAAALLGREPSGLRLPRRPFHWLLEFPEVFGRAESPRRGFDAIVGNPPFLGGQRITGNLGTDYRSHLVDSIAGGVSGSADLCAYFFLRASRLIGDPAGFGLLATNTIAQGDTREVGLDRILAGGCSIVRAIPSQPWPGGANLEVAVAWLRRGPWSAERHLDHRPVPGISALLTIPGRVQGQPHRLAANAGKSFQGSIVLGLGFVLEPEEAQALLAKDPRNREVLFPYLNGEDLNSRPDQSPSRHVINFHDWPLDRASQYPDCLAIVRERAKPERDRLATGDATARDRARRWWQFARPTMNLYATIAGLDRVLVVSSIAKHRPFSFVPRKLVLDHNLTVFSFSDFGKLSLVQSNIHGTWSDRHSSTLETRAGYRPSDCFETFPFPASLAGLEDPGAAYDAHRRAVMTARQEGLTRTYNRFHDPAESSSDIATLRSLHVALDLAVLAAYGWSDFDPGHGFHATRQGLRFTLSPPARDEILARLLELNHARHAEEERHGLTRSSKSRSKGRSRGQIKAVEGPGLFPETKP